MLSFLAFVLGYIKGGKSFATFLHCKKGVEIFMDSVEKLLTAGSCHLALPLFIDQKTPHSSLLNRYCCLTGYDVSAAPGAGLPALTPRGPPGPEAPEHPGYQRRTDQTGRLRPCPYLQLPDGTHLSGEL